VLYGSALQTLQDALYSILSSVALAKAYNVTVTINPAKWVVGTDPSITLQVGSSTWTGAGVVGVYTDVLSFSAPSSTPSSIDLLNASGTLLVSIPLSTLPYATFPPYFPPGTLRVAIAAVNLGGVSPLTAYF